MNPPTPSGSEETQKEEWRMGNVDVLRGMYEAFGRGDIEAVLASFDP